MFNFNCLIVTLKCTTIAIFYVKFSFLKQKMLDCSVCGYPNLPQEWCCYECRDRMKINRLLYMVTMMGIYVVIGFNLFCHVALEYQRQQREIFYNNSLLTCDAF